MGGRWRFRWGRNWIDRLAVREADKIMREMYKTDVETMTRVADELRRQVESSSLGTQAEVDTVIRRYYETHPERILRGGVDMIGPNGPHGPGPA